MINMRAKEAENAAKMFLNKKAQPDQTEDDMFFDAKEFHTSNKMVDSILSGANTAGVSGGEMG